MNKHLAVYLKGVGLLTGPLSFETRHSDLSKLKTFFLGQKSDDSYKAYNNFGSAVHSAFLVNKIGKWKLNIIEKRQRAGMLASLKQNVIVQRLLSQCTIFEKRKRTKLYGVRIGYTPDGGKPKDLGIDLKTTVCDDPDDFLQAAFEYGYFRQGKTYSLCEKYKEFWIIGICKKVPHPVLLICVNQHKDKMKYVEQELKWLLYMYKNYGNPKKRVVRKKKKAR